MQFLTDDECRAWATRHRYDCADHAHGPNLKPAGYLVGRFGIPNDAGRRVALCRLLLDTFVPESAEWLLWVTEWEVWPSGQHLPLVVSLRGSFNERRPIEVAPGHLFRVGEEDDALTFLCVAGLFLWDATFLPSNDAAYLHVSHDEFGLTFCRQTSKVEEIQRRFKEFDLAYAVM